jgi:two-component sensor histidine kinase
MFVIIIFLALIADTFYANYDDAVIEIVALSVAIFLIMFLQYTKREEFVAKIIVWLSAIAVFSLVFTNEFAHNSTIFLYFAPFAFYLVLDKHSLVFHASIYYLLMLGLLIYGYFYSNNRTVFDDIDSIIALCIATLFDIAIGVFIYYSIQYSLDKLKASNDEKEILLKEVHHRVKNNLNLISSILGLQNSSKDEKIHQIITRNRERIQSIATVHEMLYQHESLSLINCREYIKTITQEMILANSDIQDVKLNLEIDNIKLSLEVMIYFGLMIQEMFINSLKHTLNDKSIITIYMKKDKNIVKFEYFDNAKGCSDKTLHSTKGLGSNLIQFSAKKLHATLNVSTKPHVHYFLEFKYV